jgi:hypothetical protein
MEGPMRFAKARLAVAILALFAWVGYVAYQALAYGRFPVVSHAQLLVSTLDVIADVTADADGRPEAKVHVVEVRWPAGKKDLAGQDLTVANMTDTTGFQGPGRYVLPLVAGEHGAYRVANLPRSPGFEHTVFFIYPDTPLTRQQLDAAPKPPTAEVPPPGK